MKRRTGVIIGGAALIAALAAGAIWLVAPRSGNAEDQALAYLRALESGDVTAVDAAGLEVSPETAAAFDAASDYISEVSVVSSADSGSATIVRASYVLAGEHIDTEITMLEQSGRWVPDARSAFGAAKVDSAVEVGEARFAADALSLLPAQYELRAAPADFLEGNTTIQVAPGSVQDVAVEATLKPEATQRAQEQLDVYLESCTQPAAEVAPECGIVIPWAADFSAVSGISYRVEKSPTISLSPASFHASDGVLVATVVGTGIDNDSEKVLTYRTSNWALRGDLTFVADDIVLSLW